MAVAEVLNKLTENFARMQNQPLMISALSAIGGLMAQTSPTPCLGWIK